MHDAGSLPWLEEPLARLERLLASQRVPHGLLLQGPAGWGTASFAAEVTRRLLALPPDRAIQDLAHPDLRRVEPDGAVIKVDAIRELAAFAVGTRQQAPAKVALLESAHAMNGQAANALLKTLEEPAPQTYLVLESEYPGRLLPTIRSRVQSFAIRPQPAVAERWLRDRLEGNEQALELAFEYGGAPLAALQAADAQLEPLRGALEAGLIERRSERVFDALQAAPQEDVLLRLLRYLVATTSGQGLRALASTEPRTLVGFQQEVLALHHAMQSSNSVNVPLQFERLAHRFVSLRA